VTLASASVPDQVRAHIVDKLQEVDARALQIVEIGLAGLGLLLLDAFEKLIQTTGKKGERVRNGIGDDHAKGFLTIVTREGVEGNEDGGEGEDEEQSNAKEDYVHHHGSALLAFGKIGEKAGEGAAADKPGEAGDAGCLSEGEDVSWTSAPPINKENKSGNDTENRWGNVP
jgi:hypothetical protein